VVLEVLNKVHHKVKASSHLVGAQEELTLKPRHLPPRHPKALQVLATMGLLRLNNSNSRSLLRALQHILVLQARRPP